MKMMSRGVLGSIAILTAACSNQPDKTGDVKGTAEEDLAALTHPVNVEQVRPAEAPQVQGEAGSERFAAWAGRWTGPEGLYVDIRSLGNNRFELEMQSDLDTKGTYTGTAEERGIRFNRNGESFLLYRTSGDETGLKYLAGKQECLMVKSGEGYCRA